MKVKLLTSRAGVRLEKGEEWDWVHNDDGSSEQVLVTRDVEVGFAQNVGDVIEVSNAEAKALLESGQAEPVREARPRVRHAVRRPKADTAEAKPKAKKAEAKPKADKASS